MDKKPTLLDFHHAKQEKRKFCAVSCYDYTTAAMVAQTDIEMVLVGDSAAQVMLGLDSTLGASMDYMVTITAAVRRACPNRFVCADMPFLSYQVSREEAIRNAGRFVVEAGADCVKIEASAAQVDIIRAVSQADIPVMAHIGIRPQSVARLVKLRSEGTDAESAARLVELADRMVDAGAVMLLLEGTAREVAAVVTQRVEVPVVSCGSGPDCDGQILIISDILGLGSGRRPKFAKSFAELAEPMLAGLRAYSSAVHDGSYPDDEHCYHIKAGQAEKLETILRKP